ncbi:hypothetical protein R5W23_005633 [Gemmata sp. JC673]|uniref:HEAT repeat domain-containing protein n=1 Tax=Gemmata algarum TaxID=2975278 RepID=A0ABU5ETM0_9BACT|nr:hypothetical protein [Gemmata algarum]MDY3558515.1 hypothetical protein [Gemmata algarum]
MDDATETPPDALSDPHAAVRRRAVLADSVPPGAVAAALRDPVWCVREAAALAAGRFAGSDWAVLAALVAMTLHDPSPHVRLAAAGTAGPHVRPERDYGGAVAHRFERQRARAARALGYVAPEFAEGAVRLLARTTADSHPKVRLASLRALARIEPAAVLPLVPVVVRRCAETDPRVAAAAREVWLRVSAAPGAEPLCPLSAYPGTDDLAGVRGTLERLPADHPLRCAWDALPPVRDEGLTAHRFAKHLAAVCAHVLNGVRTS